MRSRDHILLDDRTMDTDTSDQELRQKVKSQDKCLKIQTTVMILLICSVFFLFAFYIFGDEPLTETVLKGGYQDDCGVCETIPEIDDYTVCRTCPFEADADAQLLCPVGFGDITIQKILSGDKSKKSPRKNIAALYNFCGENMVDNVCDFNYQDDILTTYEEKLSAEGQLQMVQHKGKPVDNQLRVDYTCNQVVASELLLSSTQMCNTCHSFQGIDDYEVCKTCNFPDEEDITLTCMGSFNTIQPYWIKYGRDKYNTDLLADVYTSCKDGWDTEAQSCTVNIRELYEARNGPIEDDVTAETTATDVPMVLVDENGDVIDDNFDASGKKPKRAPNSVKILYNCL